jgi:hypothetical protein
MDLEYLKLEDQTWDDVSTRLLNEELVRKRKVVQAMK